MSFTIYIHFAPAFATIAGCPVKLTHVDGLMPAVDVPTTDPFVKAPVVRELHIYLNNPVPLFHLIYKIPVSFTAKDTFPITKWGVVTVAGAVKETFVLYEPMIKTDQCTNRGSQREARTMGEVSHGL